MFAAYSTWNFSHSIVTQLWLVYASLCSDNRRFIAFIVSQLTPNYCHPFFACDMHRKLMCCNFDKSYICKTESTMARVHLYNAPKHTKKNTLPKIRKFQTRDSLCIDKVPKKKIERTVITVNQNPI